MRNPGQTPFLLALALVLALAGCAGGPPPADWALGTQSHLEGFRKHYLEGSTRLAELELERARAEIRKTGRPDLLARAELLRCAARAASLEFDDCPAFEALRRDAGPAELAYATYLQGKGAHAATDDPLSRLVSAGVQFRAGKATPEAIRSAIDTASAQGWRRPLLAWLGVEAKRAEAAGDKEAAERIRRRIALILE